MKKMDSLTGNVTRNIARTAGVAESVREPVSADSHRAARATAGYGDHIDAINQVFAELELAYHNQYHKAYSQEGGVGLAKKYWLECLAHFSPEIILQAVRNVVTTQEYLPSIATIVQACEEAMSSLGLPAAHEAYTEACLAPNPKAQQNWTHPAIYFAGRETGWFELANQSEKQIFPLFEKNYRRLCQQVLHGEEFIIERQEALPDPVSKVLSPEENKARMAELRKQLKTS